MKPSKCSQKMIFISVIHKKTHWKIVTKIPYNIITTTSHLSQTIFEPSCSWISSLAFPVDSNCTPPKAQSTCPCPSSTYSSCPAKSLPLSSQWKGLSKYYWLPFAPQLCTSRNLTSLPINLSELNWSQDSTRKAAFGEWKSINLCL